MYKNNFFFPEKKSLMKCAEMNKHLDDIPQECSIKFKYLDITKSIWQNLLQKLFEADDYFDKIEVDLINKGKPTHPIVREMLYAKAKEQSEAKHGYQFGFYYKEDANYETLVCFREGDFKGKPINMSFVC